jgi:ferritin-like metal-binding protein YciE
MKHDHQAIATLHDLLGYDAKKITDAEIHLKKTLEGYIGNTTNLKLKDVLRKYTAYIDQHIEKLEMFLVKEKIFSFSPVNKVMQAFIADTEEKLSVCLDEGIRDACLLASIQEINHYKISAYGTAAAFARVLHMEDIAAIFHEAEINEKHIDDRLSQLAEHEINVKAKTPVLLSQ